MCDSMSLKGQKGVLYHDIEITSVSKNTCWKVSASLASPCFLRIYGRKSIKLSETKCVMGYCLMDVRVKTVKH